MRRAIWWMVSLGMFLLVTGPVSNILLADIWSGWLGVGVWLAGVPLLLIGAELGGRAPDA